MFTANIVITDKTSMRKQLKIPPHLRGRIDFVSEAEGAALQNLGGGYIHTQRFTPHPVFLLLATLAEKTDLSRRGRGGGLVL